MARTYESQDKAEIARLYREGGATPTKHISDTLGITRAAAAKHVVRTRAAGLLPETSRGKATLPSHRPVRAIASLGAQQERTWTVCLECLTTWPCSATS